MTPESKIILNPRVSVFRHNGGIYLFDPATRTYASMNEAMLAFVTKPDNANSFDELSDNDHKGLSDVAEQLHRLGILIAPESADKNDRCGMPERSGSMIHLAIFVTTKCNLRCAYCYARGGDSEKTISRDIWRPAMDHFFSTLNTDTDQGRSNRKSVKLAIHGGGEATVEFATLKEIVAEFCGRASAAGLRPSVGMGTNGTYDDSVQRWIIKNNISVNISLDGPRNIQNRLRPFRSGQPSYDVVVRNLQALVQTGRRVSVRATVTNESLKTMEETIELAKQLGIASVHFEPVSLTGRCITTALARPYAEQFTEKFLKCFLLGLEHDVDVKYSGMRCFKRYHQRFCGACGQNFCITPDGNITACFEVLDSNDLAASEFFIGKVDPVQGQVVLDQVRIEQLKLRVTANMEACKSCFLRYHCAGDCPVKSFRYSNRDLYSPDSYRCQIANRINKQLIAWLANGVIEPRDVEATNVFSLNQSFI
jgi:uncharacterized protein